MLLTTKVTKLHDFIGKYIRYRSYTILYIYNNNNKSSSIYGLCNFVTFA